MGYLKSLTSLMFMQKAGGKLQTTEKIDPSWKCYSTFLMHYQCIKDICLILSSASFSSSLFLVKSFLNRYEKNCSFYMLNFKINNPL